MTKVRYGMPSKRSCAISVALAIACVISGAAPVTAADIKKVDRPLCSYAVTGEFLRGDAERIRTVLNSAEVHRLYRSHADENSSPLPAVCLDSVGGDYLEAVIIARHFASLGIGTVVERGVSCFSACALVFMAGTTFYSDAADMPDMEGELGAAWTHFRRLHITGKVGFHAPFLKMGEAAGSGIFSKETVEAAYQTAMLAVAEFLELSRRQGIGNRSPLIKQGLIAEMLRRGPDQLFEIDTIDKVGRWEIELLGFGVARQSSQRVARGRACYNVAKWKSDLPAVPELRGKHFDELVKESWSHGWNASESADYVDSSVGRQRRIFAYTAGFEAAEICQVASVPSRQSTGDDYTIAYQERSSGASIGTLFASDAQDGTKLFQGADIPAWYILDPSTPIAQLSATQVTVSTRANPVSSLFVRNPGVAYRWTGQSATTLDSIDLCEASCFKTPSCIGFTYFMPQRLCRQMAGLTELIADPRAISGHRR